MLLETKPSYYFNILSVHAVLFMYLLFFFITQIFGLLYDVLKKKKQNNPPTATRVVMLTRFYVENRQISRVVFAQYNGR